MTDMRRGRLMQSANGDHSDWTLRVRVAHCPPPPVARALSNPSWKVIVSASRGQYLKPGSYEPGFFSYRTGLFISVAFVSRYFHLLAINRARIDNALQRDHHRHMITRSCAAS